MIKSIASMLLTGTLLLAGMNHSVLAQDSLPQETQDRIKDYLEHTEARYGIVGQSVAIVKNGALVYSDARGLASLELNVDATDKTVYPVFSVAKVFVHVTIMQLVESEKIELDAPISRYLADLPESWKQITVRQAMSHVSGLPEYYRWPQPTPKTQEGAFQSVADKPLEFKAGSATRYNQTNYLLLKMIIEEVTGRDFLSVVTTRMIDKLKLANTRYGGEYAVVPGRATSYRLTPAGLRRNGPLDQPDYMFASLGLNTNVLDLALWFSALLNGQFISGETMESMWKPVNLDDGSVAGYANGWEYSRDAGVTVVGHGGGNQLDVRHYFRDSGDENVTVIYLTNGGEKDYRPSSISAGFANIIMPSALQSLSEKMYQEIANANWKGALADYQAFRSDEATRAVSTESTLNRLGYEVMFDLGAAEAVPIFQLNVVQYPSSANTYDSLGEAYLMLQDRDRARANYAKTYELQPNERVRKILDDLEQ